MVDKNYLPTTSLHLQNYLLTTFLKAPSSITKAMHVIDRTSSNLQKQQISHIKIKNSNWPSKIENYDFIYTLGLQNPYQQLKTNYQLQYLLSFKQINTFATN